MKPSDILIFRASLEPEIFRDIEIAATASLYKFATAIIDAFEFDLDHAFGFYNKLTGNYYDSKVKYELRDCARETMPSLVRHQLATTVRAELLSCIKTATDPNKNSVAPELFAAVTQSVERITDIANDRLTRDWLAAEESSLCLEFEKALAADSWRKRFRGRDILKRFVGLIHKTDYEVFRDLIIANMKNVGFKPEGMRVVIDKILNS